MALTFPPAIPDGVYSLRFYAADTATAAFTGKQYMFSLPSDPAKQGWSKAIRISATTAALEFSFDGTTVHGKVPAGATYEYLDRYEGGIAVRGAGSVFTIEAW